MSMTFFFSMPSKVSTKRGNKNDSTDTLVDLTIEKGTKFKMICTDLEIWWQENGVAEPWLQLSLQFSEKALRWS